MAVDFYLDAITGGKNAGFGEQQNEISNS